MKASVHCGACDRHFVEENYGHIHCPFCGEWCGSVTSIDIRERLGSSIVRTDSDMSALFAIVDALLEGLTPEELPNDRIFARRKYINPVCGTCKQQLTGTNFMDNCPYCGAAL